MSAAHQIPVDPKGRLDIVLRRLVATFIAPKVREIESQVGVDIWDGPAGIGAVVDAKIDELGLSQPITPMQLAQDAGFLKPQKRRLKR